MRRPLVTLRFCDTVEGRHLERYLVDLGYDVRRDLSGPLPGGENRGSDLVVINLDAAGEDGLEQLRHLRDTEPAAVLALSSSSDPVDRIAGLEMGADDFVVMPVDPQEIAARIGGILERRGIGRRDILRLERVTVDLAASCLIRAGTDPERLGPGEIVLLRALAGHPNRLLSRNDLLELAPAEQLDAHDRSIDTRIARLRRKLDTDAIVTMRGHGYMFVPPFETHHGGPPLPTEPRAKKV